MFKHLFFDDQRLYVRQGLHRAYGTPEVVGTFVDPNLTSPYGWCFAARGLDGKVHLLYNGILATRTGSFVHGFGAAVSGDGIHFVPQETGLARAEDKWPLPNQILPPSEERSEIAALVEDPKASSEERYKMLYSDILDSCHIRDDVYASPDLVHWRRMEGSCWNTQGTEPIAGAFYNPLTKGFTILPRLDWGQRRVGVTETRDWKNFTPVDLCLQCDSLDEPLAEIYGMPAFEYDGWFIGFPLIYSGFEQGIFTKYHSGEMRVQLAYSLNGRHWQRSLRTPFICGEDIPDGPWPMTFLSSMLRDEDGSLLLYVCACRRQHGTPYPKMVGNAAVKVMRLREDGFVKLATDADGEGTLALRETCWQGGPLRINLQASHATCAIYKYNSGGKQAWLSHDDCIPFAGDATCWTPRWRNGSLDDLNGKLVNIEVRLQNGALYSISYDGIPLMTLQSRRYEQFGVLPEDDRLF